MKIYDHNSKQMKPLLSKNGNVNIRVFGTYSSDSHITINEWRLKIVFNAINNWLNESGYNVVYSCKNNEKEFNDSVHIQLTNQTHSAYAEEKNYSGENPIVIRLGAAFIDTYKMGKRPFADDIIFDDIDTYRYNLLVIYMLMRSHSKPLRYQIEDGIKSAESIFKKIYDYTRHAGNEEVPHKINWDCKSAFGFKKHMDNNFSTHSAIMFLLRIIEDRPYFHSKWCPLQVISLGRLLGLIL